MRHLFFFFLPLALLSCGSSKKNYSPKDDFDKLENIFSSDNWKVTGSGADTSYWYFSRLGDLAYTVYDFKIKEGDSSLNEVSHINYSGGAIKWIRTSDTLKLVSADSVFAVWNSQSNDKVVYTFKKLSDSSISVEMPQDKKLLLTKTLSLATFLARSRYDHIHNTHTVDSPLVPRRGKPLSN
jgi:hypothetical protein